MLSQIYFPLTLGDNPAVSGGAPLTIGWKPYGRTTTDVDHHELARAKEHQRQQRVVRIPAVEREVQLLSQGYKMHQILLASEKTDKARKDRLRSIHSRKWDRFAGVLESAKTRFKTLAAKGADAAASTA